ncbi:MAG: hypothetical protein WC608_03265 [Parcubacteria group bacterium]
MLTQRDLSRGGPMYGFNLEPQYMSRTIVTGFLREFPWIENYTWWTIAEVYVEEMEPSFLGHYPEAIISGFDRTYEHITLVTKEGEEVFSEIMRERSFLGFKLKAKKERIPGRVPDRYPINYVIRRLGEKADLARFIISAHYCTKAVILYKVPKNSTLTKMLDDEIEQEHQKFHAKVS